MQLHRLIPLVALTLVSVAAAPLQATIVELKNGMRIEGVVGKLSSVGSDPTSGGSTGGVAVQLIVMIDDQLKRTFVSTYSVQDTQESEPQPTERIKINQRVASSGNRVLVIGDSIRVSPLDKWGRRIYTMQTPKGPIDVIQGVTEITPHWTRLDGLVGERSYIWDMRMRTSSIPRETLSKILMQHLDPKQSNQRLQVVRLYLQSERYRDAAAELAEVIRDFPELKSLEKEIAELRNMSADNLISEIQLYRDGGQHNLAYGMLTKFPSEGIAGEKQQRVSQLLDDYERSYERRERIFALLRKHADEFADAASKPQVDAAVDEILNALNINNLNRMADYLRLSDDASLGLDEKLSLAISGWILGPNNATENLPVALSAFEARDLVSEYLTNDPETDRAAILEKLEKMEGGAPNYVAQIMAHMRPPLADREPEKSSEIPGYFLCKVDGVPGTSDFYYYVQLPEGYDPYRRYPAIVTLHGAGTTPQQQIDWWCGGYSERAQVRLGQAARNGYIVIAPLWAEEHQSRYQYSALEHASVLFTLRDAMRRLSIDTDKIFLSGHSAGGDAAWDIGLAHPDLWAGVIPIVAMADKYVARYWENAKQVPFYFVSGELDGNKKEVNSRDWDRYLTKNNFDVTLVEYRGRGHEHFQEEQFDLFKWMALQRRTFFKKEFECATMRPWDNFFYWVEVSDFPEKSVVLPAAFPEPKKSPITVKGTVLESNGVRVESGASRGIVYLSPDMVNFNERVNVYFNRRNYGGNVIPSTEVMLEDARSRADRQHPFWAKVETTR